MDAKLHRSGGKTHLRIPAMSGIDTRALTRHIRSRGAMRAVLSTGERSVTSLVEQARSAPEMVGLDLARRVTCRSADCWPAATRERFHVAAYDFGIKRGRLGSLAARGSRVSVVPAATPAEEVLELEPHGVLLSNGPGDPEPVSYAVEAVRELLGRLPIFGICLGQQILALAVGGRTFKLPFGHHGANHPVRRESDRRVEITSQNHGFAVEPESLRGPSAKPSRR